MMERPGRRLLLHDVPLWLDADAAEYFITICCKQRGTNQLCLPGVGDALLESARFYHTHRKWVPWLFLLMPDHVHMIVSFGRGHGIDEVVSAWKRYAATQHRIVWQQGFFEHRLRRDESWQEKTDYILQNPVRAGLVREAGVWPYLLMVRE